ncbi:MAG: hypothetical protein HQL56_10345, partial [Magnetococcales bacterium]|nr:hypothetical protein [Magnetococcales bacterium]
MMRFFRYIGQTFFPYLIGILIGVGFFFLWTRVLPESDFLQHLVANILPGPSALFRMEKDPTPPPPRVIDPKPVAAPTPVAKAEKLQAFQPEEEAPPPAP